MVPGANGIGLSQLAAARFFFMCPTKPERFIYVQTFPKTVGKWQISSALCRFGAAMGRSYIVSST
ncbi:MAG TPA: hypothetical protein VF146_06405, partial [Bryobacteraceae bacterium]